MHYTQRMKELREEKELNQEQIAEKLEMHQTQYSRYERNATGMPIEVLIKLAKFHNITVDYILGLTDEKRKLF